MNFRSVIRSNYPISEFLFVGSMHIACYAMTSHEINRTHLCCIDAYIAHALMCIFCILYFQILRTYIHFLLSPVASYISERFSYRRGQNHLPPPLFFNTKVNRSDPGPGCMRKKNLSVFHFYLLWRATNIRKIFSDNLTKNKDFSSKPFHLKNHAIFSNNKNASLPYNLSFPTHIILTL